MRTLTTLIFSLLYFINLYGQNMGYEITEIGNVQRNSKNNLARHIFCMPEVYRGNSPIEAVNGFFTQHGVELFGGVQPQLVLLRESTDPSGTQIRFQQHINNIKVIDAGIVIAVNNENVITTISNGYNPELQLNPPGLIPIIDSIQAKQIAATAIENPNGFQSGKILDLALSSEFFALVWSVYVNNTNLLPFKVLVNAQNGSVLDIQAAYIGSNVGVGNVFAPDPATFHEAPCFTPTCIDALNLTEAVTIRTLPRLLPDNQGVFKMKGVYTVSMDLLSSSTTGEFFFNPSEQNEIRKFGEVNAYYHLDLLLKYVHDLGFTYKGGRRNRQIPLQYSIGGYSQGGDAYFNEEHFINYSYKGAFDQSIIAHEMSHALHHSQTVSMGSGDYRGISEGFSDYMGISYRRQFNRGYRANARFTYKSSEEPESILPPDSCNFQNMWHGQNAYVKLRPYASALMDLEYWVSTDSLSPVRLGRDTVITLQMSGFGRSRPNDKLGINILNMYQADIDIYNGDHLQDLIEVYHSRKYFYSDSTQILEQDVTTNQLLSSFFLLKDNRKVTNGAVLTVKRNGHIVLGSDFTIDNGATMVLENNVKFFNRHLRQTIHVYGTLQIGDTAKLRAHIVVHNGGTLLLNEGIAFVQQPGTVITVKDGGKVASSGAGVTLTIANDWVIEPGAVFQNIGNTVNKGLVLQPTANMNLENVTFLNTNVKGMGNFAFTNCVFTRSNLSTTAEEILLEGCVFDRSVASSGVRSFNTTRADVLDCQFLNGSGNYGLQLSGYHIYNVVNNRVEGNLSGGISIANSGLSKPQDHLIRGNTIRNNSGGEALRLYNTVAILMGNTIAGNSHGIGLYHNCLVESFGDEDSPQTISYSGTVLVQAVDNSFPWRFSYNRFEANDSDILINCFYNTANGGTEEKYRVEMNCWPWDFNPLTQLVPSDNFSWSPAWDCNGLVPFEPRTMAEALMLEGNTAMNEDNTAIAKQRFEQVVAEFPQSPFAEAALKSLRKVYHTPGYSPEAFKQYLATETAINLSPELQKIAGYLRAETDLFLANTQQALDFYQSVIANPATPADEVYATIDAEYAGLEVGNKAMTASTFTAMLSHVENHNKNRNVLLDGLKPIQRENQEKPTVQNAVDFSLSPNPARGFVDVAFIEAVNGNLTINVLSLDGRVVSSQTISATSGEKKVQRVTLPVLNQGLFLVSVMFENGHTIVRKLIVDKR